MKNIRIKIISTLFLIMQIHIDASSQNYLTIKNDFWWLISDNVENTAKEINEGLNSKGIEWLNALETREKIIKNWVIMADNNSPRAKLDVAIITLGLEREDGIKLINDYYRKVKNKSPHKDYVKVLAEKLNIKLLQHAQTGKKKL